MKRYEFNLEAVMRVRRIQESMAKAELQKANMATLVAELVAQQSLAHYDEVSTDAGSSWMAQTERAHLAAEAAIEARRSLANARVTATVAMEKYLAATQTVSVLSHLDDRRREEHAAAVQHEDMGTVDEQVATRHVRRQDQLSRKGRH
jgi:hypothetical protein